MTREKWWRRGEEVRAGGEGGGHLTCEWPRAAEGEGNEEGDWGACLKREPDIWMQCREERHLVGKWEWDGRMRRQG